MIYSGPKVAPEKRKIPIRLARLILRENLLKGSRYDKRYN